jgi:hypothetical protein
MNRSLRFRAHEWAANRFSWVQYPNIRAQSHNAETSRLRFTNQMPFGKRLDIAMFSLAALIAGIFALGVVCTLIWAFIGPIFGL